MLSSHFIVIKILLDFRCNMILSRLILTCQKHGMRYMFNDMAYASSTIWIIVICAFMIFIVKLYIPLLL